MQDFIEVTMLGKFSIYGPGMPMPRTVSLTGRARRLWILVAYLILNRERGVTASELIEVLWPEGESKDPMATLQNNISRARNALEELGLENGKKLIANRSGAYFWAPETETRLDCEQFRTALRGCLDAAGNIRDEAQAAKAVAIYTDDFLPECATDSWCVNTNAYYHAAYLQLCRKLTAYFLQERRYAETEQICRRVLGLDPGAEEFAVRLMQALSRSGMPDKALDFYEYISKLYLETYAVPPSRELEAEKALAVQQRYGGAMDEAQLAAFLSGPQQTGAFRCDNSVFREITRRELRTMERSGEQTRLLVVELQVQELTVEKRAQAMRRMEMTVLECLRMGDPFTRMGADRILIMLSGAGEEGAASVEKRICRCYKARFGVPASAFVFRSMDLRRLGKTTDDGVNS